MVILIFRVRVWKCLVFMFIVILIMMMMMRVGGKHLLIDQLITQPNLSTTHCTAKSFIHIKES